MPSFLQLMRVNWLNTPYWTERSPSIILNGSNLIRMLMYHQIIQEFFLLFFYWDVALIPLWSHLLPLIGSKCVSPILMFPNNCIKTATMTARKKSLLEISSCIYIFLCCLFMDRTYAVSALHSLAKNSFCIWSTEIMTVFEIHPSSLLFQHFPQ